MKSKLALLSAGVFAAVALAAAPQLLAKQAPPGAGIPETPRDPNAAPRIPGQNVNGMKVYIRAGLKTHNAGEHDYPQFLADFSKVLTDHGAVVDGGYHFPTSEQLKDVKVIVMYKGDTGYMTPVEKADLESFVRRGGGIVILHDAMCGPDPDYYATLLGGAKKHGAVNYTLEAPVAYTVVDKANPLVKGIDGVTITDEAFFNMTWAENPKINVLATTVIADTASARNGGGSSKVGQVVPQIWTYEHTMAGGSAPARSFVWMQGHKYENIMKPAFRDMLLRGIAWAGKQPVDSLVDYKPPARPAPPARTGAD